MPTTASTATHVSYSIAKSGLSPVPRLVRACRREAVDRPPVWLMRQAGRYMAEYQAMRAQYSFLDLCKTVDAAMEVSLQPLRAFGMDAVIMFSDILIPVEAMGMPLTFTDSKGPQLTQPIRSAADVDALRIPDPVLETGFVMDLLKALRQELAATPDVALIGFAGAPWTLASYMVEGGSSKQFTRLKTLMINEPATLHRLLDKAAQTVTLYLNAQIEAGAQVVQLFDSWGGILSAEHYREFILPYHQQVIQRLNRTHTPVILYVNGSRGLIPLMAESGADVLSIDSTTSLTDARRILGPDIALQGNLDPNALFAKPDTLLPLIHAMLRDGGVQGYIANLGHGILPQTPPDNVRLLVETAQHFR